MASVSEISCHSDANFAVICAFLERFAKSFGITYPPFMDLQEMLENTDEVPQQLADLHIKLLRKARKTVFIEKWEKAVVKFCHSYSVPDAWEIEKFGYKKARLEVKLRVLKALLEGQFDISSKFKAGINMLTASELRSTPLGKDKLGRAYWVQFDQAGNIRVYRDDPDEETWVLVARDRASLVNLVVELSVGDETFDINSLMEDSISVDMDKPTVDTGQSTNSNEDQSKQTSPNGEASENISDSEVDDPLKGAKLESPKIKDKTENSEEEDDLEKGEAADDKEESNSKKCRKLSPEPSDDMQPKKKSKVCVSKEKIEPEMVIVGEGSGQACESGNDSIVSDAIEEPTVYIYGVGSGADCDTGNPDKDSDSSKTETSEQENTNDNTSTSAMGDTSVEAKGTESEYKPTPKLWSIDTICGTTNDSLESNTTKNGDLNGQPKELNIENIQENTVKVAELKELENQSADPPIVNEEPEVNVPTSLEHHITTSKAFSPFSIKNVLEGMRDVGKTLVSCGQPDNQPSSIDKDFTAHLPNESVGVAAINVLKPDKDEVIQSMTTSEYTLKDESLCGNHSSDVSCNPGKSSGKETLHETVTENEKQLEEVKTDGADNSTVEKSRVQVIALDQTQLSEKEGRISFQAEGSAESVPETPSDEVFTTQDNQIKDNVEHSSDTFCKLVGAVVTLEEKPHNPCPEDVTAEDNKIKDNSEIPREETLTMKIGVGVSDSGTSKVSPEDLSNALCMTPDNQTIQKVEEVSSAEVSFDTGPLGGKVTGGITTTTRDKATLAELKQTEDVGNIMACEGEEVCERIPLRNFQDDIKSEVLCTGKTLTQESEITEKKEDVTACKVEVETRVPPEEPSDGKVSVVETTTDNLCSKLILTQEKISVVDVRKQTLSEMDVGAARSLCEVLVTVEERSDFIKSEVDVRSSEPSGTTETERSTRTTTPFTLETANITEEDTCVTSETATKAEEGKSIASTTANITEDDTSATSETGKGEDDPSPTSETGKGEDDPSPSETATKPEEGRSITSEASKEEDICATPETAKTEEDTSITFETGKAEDDTPATSEASKEEDICATPETAKTEEDTPTTFETGKTEDDTPATSEASKEEDICATPETAKTEEDTPTTSETGKVEDDTSATSETGKTEDTSVSCDTDTTSEQDTSVAFETAKKEDTSPTAETAKTEEDTSIISETAKKEDTSVSCDTDTTSEQYTSVASAPSTMTEQSASISEIGLTDLPTVESEETTRGGEDETRNVTNDHQASCADIDNEVEGGTGNKPTADNEQPIEKLVMPTNEKDTVAASKQSVTIVLTCENLKHSNIELADRVGAEEAKSTSHIEQGESDCPKKVSIETEALERKVIENEQEKSPTVSHRIETTGEDISNEQKFHNIEEKETSKIDSYDVKVEENTVKNMDQAKQDKFRNSEGDVKDVLVDPSYSESEKNKAECDVKEESSEDEPKKESLQLEDPSKQKVEIVLNAESEDLVEGKEEEERELRGKSAACTNLDDSLEKNPIVLEERVNHGNTNLISQKITNSDEVKELENIAVEDDMEVKHMTEKETSGCLNDKKEEPEKLLPNVIENDGEKSTCQESKETEYAKQQHNEQNTQLGNEADVKDELKSNSHPAEDLEDSGTTEQDNTEISLQNSEADTQLEQQPDSGIKTTKKRAKKEWLPQRISPRNTRRSEAVAKLPEFTIEEEEKCVEADKVEKKSMEKKGRGRGRKKKTEVRSGEVMAEEIQLNEVDPLAREDDVDPLAKEVEVDPLGEICTELDPLATATNEPQEDTPAKTTRKRASTHLTPDASGNDDTSENNRKRFKKKGKKALDTKIRRTVEEQRVKGESSSDDEKTEQAEDSEDKPKRGRPKKRKGRGRTKKSKEEDNDKGEEGDIEKQEVDENDAPSAWKHHVPARELKLLQMNMAENDEVPTVRHSRRIAQIKLKEEAERRRIEEEQLAAFKVKDKKTDKRKKKKISISEEEAEEPEAYSSDERTEKKKKRKKDKLVFNERNPWMSTSGSSSSAEDEEEMEEEDAPEEDIFKSDHEFSPESDVDDPEYMPVKRARTARAQDGPEGDKRDEKSAYEDTACEKCDKTDHPELILLCDNCDKGWHASCLRPALLIVPEGDWFCPPCEHVTLVVKLRENLIKFDRLQKQRENEELRKKRLAFVGISLDNVLPTKKEGKKHKSDEDGSGSGSRSGSGSDTSGSRSSGSSDTDSSEPVYQLRERRTNIASYRYNEYDELIKSAIQDEMDAGKAAGNAGKGKDIQTIVEAEKGERDEDGKEDEEEDADDEEGDEEQGVGGAPTTSATRAPEEDHSIDTEEEEAAQEKDEPDAEPVAAAADGDDAEPEELPPVVPRYEKKKKKSRRLAITSLDFTSEEEDRNSDSDFKGDSSEEESEASLPTESDYSSDNIGRKRKGRGGPVRRSTRARRSRYDREFINDDSEDDAPRRKKSKNVWASSESSDTDRSWGRKKKKGSKVRATGSSKSRKSSEKKKKKKKKRHAEKGEADGEDESGTPSSKKPRNRKVRYGGLDSGDEGQVLTSRTRGRKINYVEDDSDSEEVPKKASAEPKGSDDEFKEGSEDESGEEDEEVEDAEEDEDEDEGQEQAACSESDSDTVDEVNEEIVEKARNKKSLKQSAGGSSSSSKVTKKQNSKSGAKKSKAVSGSNKKKAKTVIPDPDDFSEDDLMEDEELDEMAEELEDLDEEEEEILGEMLEAGDIPVHELKSAVKRAKEERRRKKEARDAEQSQKSKSDKTKRVPSMGKPAFPPIPAHLENPKSGPRFPKIGAHMKITPCRSDLQKVRPPNLGSNRSVPKDDQKIGGSGLLKQTLTSSKQGTKRPGLEPPILTGQQGPEEPQVHHPGHVTAPGMGQLPPQGRLPALCGQSLPQLGQQQQPMHPGPPPPQMSQQGPHPPMHSGPPPHPMGQPGPQVPHQIGQRGPQPPMLSGPPPPMGQQGPPPPMHSGQPPPPMGLQGPQHPMLSGQPPPPMGLQGPPPPLGLQGPQPPMHGQPPPPMGQQQMAMMNLNNGPRGPLGLGGPPGPPGAAGPPGQPGMYNAFPEHMSPLTRMQQHFPQNLPTTVANMSNMTSMDPSKERRKPGPKPGSKNKKKEPIMSPRSDGGEDGEGMEGVEMKGVDDSPKRKGRGRGKKQLLAMEQAQVKPDVTIATVQAPTQFPPQGLGADGGSVITRMLNTPQGPQSFPPGNRAPFRPQAPPSGYPGVAPVNRPPGSPSLTPMRLRAPAPTTLYHSGHPLDPSPSGGGPISISSPKPTPPQTTYRPGTLPLRYPSEPFTPASSSPRPEGFSYPGYYNNSPNFAGAQPAGGGEQPEFQNPPYNEQFEDAASAPAAETSSSKSFEDDPGGGEFGGLASYFASQHEDGLDT